MPLALLAEEKSLERIEIRNLKGYCPNKMFERMCSRGNDHSKLKVLKLE